MKVFSATILASLISLPVINGLATRAVGTRVVSSKTPAPRTIATDASGKRISQALPYGQEKFLVPSIMDGSTLGDFGFDPASLSMIADQGWGNFMALGLPGWKWVQEAELMNARNAMVGVVGMIVPYAFFGKTGSPLDVPGEDLVPVALTMGLLEWKRIQNIRKEGANYQPGDMQKWGQGEGERFNPLGLDYDQEYYEYLRLSELKNGRLAMIGFIGLYLQAQNSGMNICDQLGETLSTPQWQAKAGYFFPEGI